MEAMSTTGPTRQPSRRPGPSPVQRRRRGLVVLVGFAVLVIWAISALSSGNAPDRPGGAGTTAVAVDPAAFAAGACMALAPTHGDRHRTVFLDAGHGGRDPGAVGTTQSGATIYEADATLPVELDAAADLRADGYRVVVSRTGNTSVVRLSAADISGRELSLQGAHDDVEARDLCANRSHASVLVGVYFDSGGSAQDAGSLTAYDAARPFADDNLRLADLVQHDVLNAMNAQGWAIPDAGVTTDGSVGSLVPTGEDTGLAAEAAAYGHLLLLGPFDPGFQPDPSTMPGAVIEPLFVTDPFEASIAASAHGQSVIAGGIATAVEEYLSPPNGSTSSHPSSSAHGARPRPSTARG